MTQPLLEVRDLKKSFTVKTDLFGRPTAQVKALDAVSFTLNAGETLGLVGESGCGKSTTGRAVLRLIEPDSGSVRFEGKEVTSLSPAEMRPLRREMQLVFQDPYSSLNPRMTIRQILEETYIVHGVGTRDERRDRIESVLDRVGIRPDQMDRFPHEFSGGQRQRIGIARALMLNPKFIVADEPVSALDVSIQAQVLNLLTDIQDEFGIAFLFIGHDLAVVEHISHRIGVMYLGRMVELASDTDLYATPLHPYTQVLLEAIPSMDPNVKPARASLRGEVPSPLSPPSGCHFHTRCPHKKPICEQLAPPLAEAAPGHMVACHLYSTATASPVIEETSTERA
ncbi:ABC transporter ATP-binding protein [Maritimibacter alkaliphilus]|uniref:ABC transporter ATP-binding protein n=1 Tax=Maritimibacter alkaliphilus TaxID=404236 RepID=UPI001C94F1E8|nr:dipeptide ABC transporter ATP-binding protein [Maritimibacter alkaliphilus]MBY6088939.1 dipeptide ABC transporter ATP-binding protein [Maritimibacter alkaliphilus]